MSVAQSQRRSELECADYQKQDWPGIGEGPSPSIHLMEQKENSHRDYNRGALQALDHATLAMTFCWCTHLAALLNSAR
jgi:hypothetical protein